MKSKYIGFCVFLLILLCFAMGCVPTPDNGQIEAAIRSSLSGEAAPPALDFTSMEVPMRASGNGKANRNIKTKIH